MRLIAWTLSCLGFLPSHVYSSDCTGAKRQSSIAGVNHLKDVTAQMLRRNEWQVFPRFAQVDQFNDSEDHDPRDTSSPENKIILL